MIEGNGEAQPDVLALDEGVAREALHAAGLDDIRVIATTPPWPGTGLGPRRVLRQRTLPDGAVELVVAHVRYEGRKRGSK